MSPQKWSLKSLGPNRASKSQVLAQVSENYYEYTQADEV